MTFSSSKDAMVNVVTLSIARVKEIMAINRAGQKVNKLQDDSALVVTSEEPTYRSEEDSITRFDRTKRRKRNRNNRNDQDRRNHDRTSNNPRSETQTAQPVENTGATVALAENSGSELHGDNREGKFNQNRHNNRNHRHSHRPRNNNGGTGTKHE